LFLIHTKRLLIKEEIWKVFYSFLNFLFFSYFCKITQIIFNSGMAMQNKYNQFFNFFLFSGLACFSYLSLVLYTDLTPQHQKILISSLGFISVVFIFNLVGFSLIVINRWLKKKLSILYQEEKQADYQLHFDCSYSFLHELRYSDHL
jgi:histidine kinase